MELTVKSDTPFAKRRAKGALLLPAAHPRRYAKRRHPHVPTHQAKPTYELRETHWQHVASQLCNHRLARIPGCLQSEGEAGVA